MTPEEPDEIAFGEDPPEGDAEGLLMRLSNMVQNAKSLPLSTSIRLERDELLALVHRTIEHLPEELRQARWLLKERQEFLSKMQREGDELIDSARQRAEQMVQRTEIVREAQHAAQRVVDQAREEARKLRLEAEDYCDQKLAAFEIVLERTAKTVEAGREKLKVTPLAPTEETGGFFEGEATEDEGGDAFFDQDES
jgi:DNA primase